jgi:hypothetical protein
MRLPRTADDNNSLRLEKCLNDPCHPRIAVRRWAQKGWRLGLGSGRVEGEKKGHLRVDQRERWLWQ